jgi:hypothetical protein
MLLCPGQADWKATTEAQQHITACKQAGFLSTVHCCPLSVASQQTVLKKDVA